MLASSRLDLRGRQQFRRRLREAPRCLRRLQRLRLRRLTCQRVRVISCSFLNCALETRQVIDRRLRPPPCVPHVGGYFKHASFSCRYIRRDIVCIMCRHDVINIQHAHCGLVGPDCRNIVVQSVRCLQRVFLRAKLRAACEPRCLSWAATSRQRSSSQLAYVQI